MGSHRQALGRGLARPDHGNRRIVRQDSAQREDDRRRLVNPAQTYRIVLVKYGNEPVSLGSLRLHVSSRGLQRDLSWKVNQCRRTGMAFPDFDRASDLKKLSGDLRPAQPVRLGLEQRNERRMLLSLPRDHGVSVRTCLPRRHISPRFRTYVQYNTMPEASML
jgi:hypothetical protein